MRRPRRPLRSSVRTARSPGNRCHVIKEMSSSSLSVGWVGLRQPLVERFAIPLPCQNSLVDITGITLAVNQMRKQREEVSSTMHTRLRSSIKAMSPTDGSGKSYRMLQCSPSSQNTRDCRESKPFPLCLAETRGRTVLLTRSAEKQRNKQLFDRHPPYGQPPSSAMEQGRRLTGTELLRLPSMMQNEDKECTKNRDNASTIASRYAILGQGGAFLECRSPKEEGTPLTQRSSHAS